MTRWHAWREILDDAVRGAALLAAGLLMHGCAGTVGNTAGDAADTTAPPDRPDAAPPDIVRVDVQDEFTAYYGPPPPYGVAPCTTDDDCVRWFGPGYTCDPDQLCQPPRDAGPVRDVTCELPATAYGPSLCCTDDDCEEGFVCNPGRWCERPDGGSR